MRAFEKVRHGAPFDPVDGCRARYKTIRRGIDPRRSASSTTNRLLGQPLPQLANSIHVPLVARIPGLVVKRHIVQLRRQRAAQRIVVITNHDRRLLAARATVVSASARIARPAAAYPLSRMDDSPSAIVFDLDGVLIDSRVPISESISYALKTHGLPGPKLDQLERFIGPPLTVAFAELVGESPDSPLVLECLASYRDRYREVSLRETTVFPGIPDALAILERSHRLAVATSKPLAFAEPLLVAFDLRASFEYVAGPDLDAHREDKQATIGRALAALDTTRAVMIGDRSFDIVGAHACGIPAIGVSWGIGDTHELIAAGAETVVYEPLELGQAVRDLLRQAPWTV